MTKLQAAWLAGLFDGEGYVGFVFRKPSPSTTSQYGYWTLEVNIGNTHAPTIQKVFELLKLGHIQKVTKKPPHKDLYLWRATAASAAKFLLVVRPFCVTKLERIEIALAARKLRQECKTKWREPMDAETHNKLKDLSNLIRSKNSRRGPGVLMN